MAWKLEGTYIETCNCDAACPCVFLSDPTEGDCGVLVGFHIDQGHDGDVSLDGLNVALAIYSPGNMATNPWTAAAYVDERASEAQHASLVKIFGGQAGGHPAALAEHIGEMVGVESVAIAFEAGERRFTVRVGELGTADIERIDGQGGGPVTITGHPLAIAPGIPATVARSRQLSFHDHGWDWSESDKTAFFSPFSYSG